MMRSLWTAASGMMAQQTSVDTISNNLANVNTVGYKSESTEFKSLLYQNLQARTTSANGEFKPVSAQVGLGARVSSITSHYTQGAMNASDSATVEEKVSAGDTQGVNGDDPSSDGSSAEGTVDEELEAAEATDMVPEDGEADQDADSSTSDAAGQE